MFAKKLAIVDKTGRESAILGFRNVEIFLKLNISSQVVHSAKYKIRATDARSSILASVAHK
jgi:hypothetical protein